MLFDVPQSLLEEEEYYIANPCPLSPIAKVII